MVALKHFILIIGILFFFMACRNVSHPAIPVNIIQPDSMAELLTEVHILQSSLQLGYSRNDSIISARQAFDELWEEHHISEMDYNRYVDFYTHHPGLLDSVYEKVISNLSQRKAELQGKAKH